MLVISKGRTRQQIAKTAHNIRYINWEVEATKISLDREEFNAKLDELAAIPQKTFLTNRKTLRKVWFKTWHYDELKKAIYYADEVGNYFIYYATNKVYKEKHELSGTQCARLFWDEFMKRYKIGQAAAFGAIPIRNRFMTETIHKCNRCVGPFIWADEDYTNTHLEGLYKADVSSAYPFSAGDKLPDARTAKIVEGRESPSAEWPVAFYTSGHIAEYGMYDTHRDSFNFLYREARNKITPSKHGEPPVRFGNTDEKTILMKYSKYSLKDTFEHFYKLKEIDETAKQIINLTIGTFDMLDWANDKKGLINWNSSYSYYGHLRAVVLARHNHRMCQEYNNLMKKGYELVSIQTDSLMWIGGPYEGAVKEKKIGNLVSEIENGYGFNHGCGAYWVNDDKREKPIVKAQGIKEFPKDEMTEEKIFIDWFKTHQSIEVFTGEQDPITHKFVKRKVRLEELE